MTAVRRAGTASAAVVSGLALSLGLAHAAAPEWTRRAGLDVWDLAEDRTAMRAATQESSRLREEAEQMHESIEAMDHTAARLSVGQLSLAEAAAATEPLLRDRTGFPSAAELYYPAPTFRLSVARFLIERVRRTLHADPSRSAVVAARLKAEYAAMK